MGLMRGGGSIAELDQLENEYLLGGQTVENVLEQYKAAVSKWVADPVRFAKDVLNMDCDPWQADVLDAIMVHDNVAIRACHGVGKTAVEAAAILWFTMTRYRARVPTTAPTFNKQVRDILWAEIHLRWIEAQKLAPWLSDYFQISVTRFASKQEPQTWFAVGIPSAEAIKAEGYHSQHLMAVIDEAKGVKKTFFEALEGMRTTQEAKLVAASTPGGPMGYFYDIFVKYRSTWKSQFIIHPEALRETLRRKEARSGDLNGGTRYSRRVRPEWVEARRQEWGEESPVFVARVRGDFPQVSGDTLIPYGWLVDAEHREEGAVGVPCVGCDVARYGRDRTLIWGGAGGTVKYGESIARTAAETTDIAAMEDVGPDPSRPRYRSIVATADRCQAMRRKLSAETGVDRIPIVIDDTGLGGGVVDLLQDRGEWAVPINFGARPTDVPKDADERARRQRRHILDSKYVNLKAEMGWQVRGSFEIGAVGLAQLPKELLDALIQQASMMKYEMDSNGRLRLVDPDEQDEYAAAAGLAEGRKSPDHFHALLLYLFVALQFTTHVAPHAGPRLPKGVHSLGRGVTLPIQQKPAGQAAWVTSRRYR